MVFHLKLVSHSFLVITHYSNFISRSLINVIWYLWFTASRLLLQFTTHVLMFIAWYSYLIIRSSMLTFHYSELIICILLLVESCNHFSTYAQAFIEHYVQKNVCIILFMDFHLQVSRCGFMFLVCYFYFSTRGLLPLFFSLQLPTHALIIIFFCRKFTVLRVLLAAYYFHISISFYCLCL